MIYDKADKVIEKNLNYFLIDVKIIQKHQIRGNDLIFVYVYVMFILSL